MYPHQLEALKDRHRFKVLVWHRRARKTTTAIEKMVAECLNPNVKNAVYWHIFPTYAEAKDAVWRDPKMLFRICPKEVIRKTHEQDLTIYFKTGSILQLKGADKPERLLGAGPYGVVLDEFAEMKLETWTRIIQPILRANGGWCWFIGTPKGKNHLYQLYNKGQDTTSEEWKSWLMKASSSGVIPQDQLENAKGDMPQNLYNQELECDFLEGEGAVFRGVREVCTAVPRKPIRGRVYVMGVDLGKANDYTVITIYDRHSLTQVYQDRFRHLEWPFQKKRIRVAAKHFNGALVYLDASGLGDPIADDLIRAGVAVEPIKFTSQIKKEMIEKLSIWIEQQRIKILKINATLEEFDNFTYEIGPTGNIRYGALPGFHDDIVISQALAVWGLTPRVIKEGSRPPSKIRQKFIKDLERMKGDKDDEYEEEWFDV